MNFFSAEPNNLVLHEFDAMHLGAIIFFTAAMLIMILFRKYIHNAAWEKGFRYTITIVAILFEVVFKIWDVINHGGSFLSEYLPLDLCAISLYLCWALCFSKQQWIFKLVYFYSMGALVSLFVPELGGFGINHFRYYHYFYVHGYIIFVSLYFAAVHQYKIVFKDLLKASGILTVLAAFVMLVDYLVGGNYMYLMHKPTAGSPLDLFGPWPGYVLWMAVTVIVVFIIVYIPWIFINNKKTKKISSINT